MRLRLPLLLGALVLGPTLAAVSPPESAQASIATAATLEGLVSGAQVVALAEPESSESQWEGGRIMTYTKLRVLERLGGDAPEHVWVKSLGGMVGKIGQAVEGEPVFPKGTRTMVFLRRIVDPTHPDVHLVVARGQGAYPLVQEKSRWTVRAPMHLGTIIPRSKHMSTVPAMAKLAGRPFDDVALEVRALWTEVHAQKK